MDDYRRTKSVAGRGRDVVLDAGGARDGAELRMMSYSLYTLEAPSTFGSDLSEFLQQGGADTSKRWNRTFRLWGDWLKTKSPKEQAESVRGVVQAIRGAKAKDVRMEVARIAFGHTPLDPPFLGHESPDALALYIEQGFLAEMSFRMETRAQWTGISILENQSDFYRAVLAAPLQSSTRLEFMLRRERWSEWLNPALQPALESLLWGVTSKFRLEILPFYRNIFTPEALEHNRDTVARYTPDIARMTDALGFSLQDFGYPPSNSVLRAILREPVEPPAGDWSLPNTVDMA